MSLEVLESKEYFIGLPCHCTYRFFIKLGNQRRLTLRGQPIKSIPVETNYVISTKKLQRRPNSIHTISVRAYLVT